MAFPEYVDSALHSETSPLARNARTSSTRQSRAPSSICPSFRLFITHAGTRMARVPCVRAYARAQKTTLSTHPGNGRTVAQVAVRQISKRLIARNIGTCICHSKPLNRVSMARIRAQIFCLPFGSAVCRVKILKEYFLSQTLHP